MLTPLKRIGLAALVSLVSLSLAALKVPAQSTRGTRPTPITIPPSTTISGPRQTPLNQGITGQVGLTSSAFAALYPSLSSPLSNPSAPASQFSALTGLTNPYAGLSPSPYGNTAAGYGASGLGTYGGGGYGSYYPTQYIEASRFLSNFDDALKVLSQPDAGDYFTAKYTAQGRTVAELVKHMTAQGLTFAPAIPGDGPAYLALHRALVAYDVSGQARMMTAEH